MNKKSKKAFTFIELLIALTIFSIIAASIYYTLNAGIRVWSRGNSIIRDNQRLRIFFDTISTDMKNAVPPLLAGEDFIIKSEWDFESVSFPTIINVFYNDCMNTELAGVRYYLDKDGDKRKFIRKLSRIEEGFDDSNTPEEILLEESEDFTIESVTFRYYYKEDPSSEVYEWKESWESNIVIPRGVKIELILKNKITKNLESFENIIFIPIGKATDEEEAGP